MKNIIKFLMLIFFICVFVKIPVQAVTEDDVKTYGTRPSGNVQGYWYFINTEDLVLLKADGSVSRTTMSALKKSVKKYFYDEISKAATQTVRFKNKLDVYKNFVYSSGKTPAALSDVVTWGTNSETLTLKVNGSAYTFYIPSDAFDVVETKKNKKVMTTYSKNNVTACKKYGKSEKQFAFDYAISQNAEICIKELVQASKEGLVACNIEKGFNVGSVYSTVQKPLSEVMHVKSNYVTQTTTEDTTTKKSGQADLTTTSGELFVFTEGKTLKATMDFFYCPFFGKVSVGDIPKDSDAWDKKAKDIKVEGLSVVVNEGYLDFIEGSSPENEGIQDSENLYFTNGVKAYKNGISTEEPLQKVNYNMRIVTPKYFKGGVGDTYSLDLENLSEIPDIRMSVYNDTLYKTDEDTGKVVRVCTNADLDLSRDNIAFFYTMEGTEKVGAVIILQYNECVADPSEDDVYLTGRKITFSGNYSNSLNLDVANKDVMSALQDSSTILGIMPRYFAFNAKDVAGSKPPYMLSDTHSEINTEGFVFYTAFQNVFMNGETEVKKDADGNVIDDSNVFMGFVIYRNNYYITDDGALLNWLSTDEASSTPFVSADILRAKIRGEFKAGNISYSDWVRMQEVKENLANKKDGVLVHIAMTACFILGVLFVFFGIFLCVAYWFDIFNTFIDISIIRLISFGKMYPVEDRDLISEIHTGDTSVRYVTFKDILIISVICVLVGFGLMHADSVVSFIAQVYGYIVNKI